jgi:hypothetical protein
MSLEQEEQVVNALTNRELNWMPDPQAFARHTIGKLCSCSADEADSMLERIYVDRKLIALVSESGGTPAATETRALDSYGFKWVRSKVDRRAGFLG